MGSYVLGAALTLSFVAAFALIAAARGLSIIEALRDL